MAIEVMFYSQLRGYVTTSLKSNHTHVFLLFVFIWFQASWKLNKLGKAEIRGCAITIVTLIKRELLGNGRQHYLSKQEMKSSKPILEYSITIIMQYFLFCELVPI